MTTMKSNLHPSTEMLEKFVSGDLSVGVNLAISAHVEMCDQCKSVESVPAAVADAFSSDLRDTYRFETDISHVSIHGRCSACAGTPLRMSDVQD